jgi:hypothetical protein
MTNSASGRDGRQVRDTLDRINSLWLQGRAADLAPLIHDDVVMVFPGFTGRAQGQGEFLAGFDEFCRNATVRDFQVSDRQIDVIGSVAVATFAFEMVYERDGQAYRSTGRDQWVFQEEEEAWRAVWRTMLEITENPLGDG